MSNRRKTGQERRAKLGHPLSSGTPMAGGLEFNQMARRSCDECGSPVEWMTGDEATSRGADLAGAMEFLGISSVPDRNVWMCTRCDNYGVMGPAEGEWF